jgi:hypothetical protein
MFKKMIDFSFEKRNNFPLNPITILISDFPRNLRKISGILR